jgi:hypothetical protein
MLGAGQRGIELNRERRHPLCLLSNFAAFLHRTDTRRQHRLLGSAVSFSLRLHIHWLTAWKRNDSTHKETLALLFSPFFFFAFDLLHPLHISGPRCTGRILRILHGYKKGTCFSQLEAHIGLGKRLDSDVLPRLGWRQRTGVPQFSLGWRYKLNDGSDGLVWLFLCFYAHCFYSFHELTIMKTRFRTSALPARGSRPSQQRERQISRVLLHQ